jgi:hypothetical protein
MDIIFDMFTLRNVNRPYTEKELEEIYKKDHSIQEEHKQSRLKRCVSINDIEHDNVTCKGETDTNKKASTSSGAKDDEPSINDADTTQCDDQ